MFEVMIKAENFADLRARMVELMADLDGKTATPQTGQVLYPEVAPAAPVTPMAVPASYPVTPPPVAAPAVNIPTSAIAEKYTLDQLQVAMGGLVDAGKMPTVQKIMTDFGVCAVTEIPEDSYPALVTKLRQEGAKI